LLDSTESARAARAVALRSIVVNSDEAQRTVGPSAASSGLVGRLRLIGRTGILFVVVAGADCLEIPDRDDPTATRELHQRPPRDAQAVAESHDGQAVASIGLLVPSSHRVGERSTDPQQAGCLLHGVQDRRLNAQRTSLPNGAHVA